MAATPIAFTPGNEQSDALVVLLRGTVAGLVSRDGPDLSARQLAIFLICYLEQPAQTVRGLATNLRVSRPAITRGLDRLTHFDLVRRKLDPADRRSILVQRTASGNSFLRELRGFLNAAAKLPAGAAKLPAGAAKRPAGAAKSPAGAAKAHGAQPKAAGRRRPRNLAAD